MANPRKAPLPHKPVSPPVAGGSYSADDYYRLYNQTVLQQPARLLHLMAIPIFLFGLFGLLWAIPFPHLGFLGTYNGFFNWASFLLAAMIYFYLRLSPTISYVLLFFLLLCAYGVVQLSAWQVLGGPQQCLVSGVLLIISGAVLVLSGNSISAAQKTKLALAAPVWEIYSILNRKPVS